MSVPFNADWMQRAFLKVEAELLNRIATHAAQNITEETLRDSLFQGLGQTEPARQAHVRPEGHVSWQDSKCFSCSKTPSGGGRKKAHDVVVDPHQVGGKQNNGLACEVKWLKATKKGQTPSREGELMADVLRLVFTRGQAGEGKSSRVFLLLGGESKVFGKMLSRLQDEGVDLRWSPAGKQSAPDAMPGDKRLMVRSVLRDSKLAKKELQDLMAFGKGHYRQPADVWSRLTISLRARWLQTASGRSWRMALWEFHHWGVGSKPLPGKEVARKFRPLHQRKKAKKRSTKKKP